MHLCAFMSSEAVISFIMVFDYLMVVFPIINDYFVMDGLIDVPNVCSFLHIDI